LSEKGSKLCNNNIVRKVDSTTSQVKLEFGISMSIFLIPELKQTEKENVLLRLSKNEQHYNYSLLFQGRNNCCNPVFDSSWQKLFF